MKFTRDVFQIYTNKTKESIINIRIYFCLFKNLFLEKVIMTSDAVSHRANQYMLTWKSVRSVDFA